MTRWASISHPLTRGMDLDDVRVTLARREIIQRKKFLKTLYNEWYRMLKDNLPADERVLEIGSGAGFLKDLLPSVITSEVFAIPGVDRVEDACRLDFPNDSLGAIVMLDVFHHIRDVRAFLIEARRVLCQGGRILMIEPWRSRWSSVIYRNLHHEPFDTDAADWRLPSGGGPLSTANGALPWIVFERDRDQFEAEFPEFSIVKLEPLMPLAYLVSGGVGTQVSLPRSMYRPVRILENKVVRGRGAMFALIVLEKA